MADEELKQLGIRVPISIAQDFTSEAMSKGKSQGDFFSEIYNTYKEHKDASRGARDIPREDDIPMSRVSPQIENLIKKIEALSAEMRMDSSRKNIQEIAQEMAAVATMAQSQKKLLDVMNETKRTIIESAKEAEKPFRAVVEDRAKSSEAMKLKLNEMVVALTAAINALQSKGVEINSKFSEMGQLASRFQSTVEREESKMAAKNQESGRWVMAAFYMGGLASVICACTLFYGLWKFPREEKAMIDRLVSDDHICSVLRDEVVRTVCSKDQKRIDGLLASVRKTCR